MLQHRKVIALGLQKMVFGGPGRDDRLVRKGKVRLVLLVI